MQPSKPTNLSASAEACLVALGAEGLGRYVALGGAVALSYYLEYRETRDVDAWWEPAAGQEARLSVIRCIERVLAARGKVKIRAWGDVVSIELLQDDRTVFSFQVAQRSAQLRPTEKAPWPEGVGLDAFEDLVAAKMTALVERGTPRDFRDIHAVVKRGLIDSTACWSLWRRRQQIARQDASPPRARLALESHLARIETHRPLEGIADPAERSAANELRTWFREVFFNALMD